MEGLLQLCLDVKWQEGGMGFSRTVCLNDRTRCPSIDGMRIGRILKWHETL
jgi:hypothetical protein